MVRPTPSARIWDPYISIYLPKSPVYLPPVVRSMPNARSARRSSLLRVRARVRARVRELVRVRVRVRVRLRLRFRL